MRKKNRYLATLMLIATAIIISPLDDIAIAAVFGSVLFPIGSLEWYIIVISLTTISLFLIVDWRKKK